MNIEMSQTEYQILAYLIEHPEAVDTLDGILQWWMLERAIRFQKTQIAKAIEVLVDKGLVIERRGLDLQSYYRINRNRIVEIKKLIGQ